MEIEFDDGDEARADDDKGDEGAGDGKSFTISSRHSGARGCVTTVATAAVAIAHANAN